ncbi:MAG: alpha/beta hydrolase [bacterium]
MTPPRFLLHLLPRPLRRLAGLAIGGASLLGAQQAPPSGPAAVAPVTMSFGQVAALPAPPATVRVRYGADSVQFGDLRLPTKGKGPFPVVVLLHGGCWLSQYDLRYLNAMGAALADDGFAVWTPEFRRVGDAGGGYPGTMLDAATATDYVRVLARTQPLDTAHVVLAGHSAGGHLALLVAGRAKRASPHPLAGGAPLPISGVVSIDGITDLAGYAGTSGCNAAVARLMQGMPGEQPDRYRQFSPIELLPLGVRVRLLNGYYDKTVPLEQARSFARKAYAAGDDAQFVLLEHSAHFDPVAPTSPDWPSVLGAIRSMSGMP